MRAENCRNFSEVIDFQSRANPDRVFIFDIKTGRELSYLEFETIVGKTSRFLLENGVREGGIITTVLPNSPEYCFFYFASLRIGAIFNPMPFSSHPREVERNIRMTKPDLVVIDQQKKLEFDASSPRFLFIPSGKSRAFEDSLSGYDKVISSDHSIDNERPACLYYSSGTTDDPKGVLFTHKNMISNISSLCRGFEFRPDLEIHLCILPLGHTASINYSLLPCAFLGGTVVMAEDFWTVRHRIWNLIETYQVTYFETVPTILYSLLNIYRRPIDQDVSSVRFVGCGSAPLQKTIQEEFENRFGLKVANLYGLSETGPSHIDFPPAPGWKPGSIGVPLDVNHVEIWDDQGKETLDGEIGEIVIKGDNVFPGYFGNEALSRSVMRDDFFLTGDLGYRNESGVFYFVDRKKDIIIKGGINIIPGEIDEILLMHPAVKEGVTVGVRDDLFGEEILSYVVLKKGLHASPKDLLDHCRRHLTKIKIPKEITIVPDLPKTHSGKLLRRELRAQKRKKT